MINKEDHTIDREYERYRLNGITYSFKYWDEERIRLRYLIIYQEDSPALFFTSFKEDGSVSKIQFKSPEDGSCISNY